MLLVIACIVSSVLAALVGVAYFVLNKPVKEEAPLLSRADIMALASKFNTASSRPVPYSNVLGYSLGHGGHVLSPPGPIAGSLSIRGCNNLCNGTPTCKGFQFNSTTSTCELLSNIANTYYTYDQGWNLFVTGTVADIAMGAEQPGMGYSTSAPVITGATTYEKCAPYCFSNLSSCKGMSISPSGCGLLAVGAISAQSAGTSSWQTTQITHGNGLPSSPAPAPS